MNKAIATKVHGLSDKQSNKLKHGMHHVIHEVQNCKEEGIKPAHDHIVKDAAKHVQKIAANIERIKQA